MDVSAKTGGTKAASTLWIVCQLLELLDERRIRYSHWKSNCRLQETLIGTTDLDVMVDRRDATAFDTVLAEIGFKRARSGLGLEHPGVFHAYAFDTASAKLVHLHVYFQIVSGDSLVKSYHLPLERLLLEDTRRLYGATVPSRAAELLVFTLRIALKHVSPIEVLLVNRRYREVLDELFWLLDAHTARTAKALVASHAPTIEPALLERLFEAIATPGALLRRVVLGWSVAWRLRGWRRIGVIPAIRARWWHVLLMLLGRRQRKRLLAGGAIIALVGPKAVGKSTISDALAQHLGRHLDLLQIHAGKPPATAVSFLPSLLLPVARAIFPADRSSEYESGERRDGKSYSLLYVFRRTMLAYDRRVLLLRAARAAASGRIVVSDRYPSETVGIPDSPSFDDGEIERCRRGLKRWLMATERRLYLGLPRPNMIVRLVASMEKAIERDATRTKVGGPAPDAIRRRRDLEKSGRFEGVPTLEISSDGPLDDTVCAVMRAVWNLL